ncbi:MAG: ATP-binding protein [Hungatella sp.]|nr:ATP-binding protein [Hungatella sp.]
MILYRNFKYQQLFDEMAQLLLGTREGEILPDPCSLANQLIELAADYGFEGNLWHCFLAFCLANHENAYSISCEIRGDQGGTLSRLARQDFTMIQQLFKKDIQVLDKLVPESSVWSELASFEPSVGFSRIFNRRIRDRIIKLSVTLAEAEDVEGFAKAVSEFYREFGVGKYGLNKAFRIKEDRHTAFIEPVVNVEHVYLEDLIGYELQKKKLIENTECFIQGRAANNVLLYGDAGTGKSSSIKAILNKYYDQGLRIIEVYKHQFHALSSILEQIQDRNYKFIIFMDDLSFEESELEYKYLKAIIEGGLGRKPQNALIYATSNRRHLIREKFSDKRELDDELHINDTVQEKLSLVARFGVTIYFGSPDKREFQHIVKALAQKYAITMAEDQLYEEANKWELYHGGLSGRTAMQFITYLLGSI